MFAWSGAGAAVPTATGPPLPVGKAVGRQALCCHLVLLGLTQSKPNGVAKACTGQAHAAIDGIKVCVYPPPKALGIHAPWLGTIYCCWGLPRASLGWYTWLALGKHKQH